MNHGLYPQPNLSAKNFQNNFAKRFLRKTIELMAVVNASKYKGEERKPYTSEDVYTYTEKKSKVRKTFNKKRV